MKGVVFSGRTRPLPYGRGSERDFSDTLLVVGSREHGQGGSAPGTRSSEEVTELLDGDANVDGNDLSQEASRDVTSTVYGHGGLAAVGMLEASMGAAGARLDKPQGAQGADELPRGDGRRCAHATISRSRTPTKIAPVAGFSSSRHSAAASAMLAIASSTVRPDERQPRKVGMETMKIPSSSCSMRTGK